MPRYVPTGEAPLVTIAPPTPAPDVEDPALKAVDDAARRAAYARELHQTTGDPYRSQYNPAGAFISSAHSFFRDLLLIADSEARAKETPPGAFVGYDVAAARKRIDAATERAKKIDENRAREQRDLTTASTPDFQRPYNVPEWIADAFGRASRQRGTLASVFPRGPLHQA